MKYILVSKISADSDDLILSDNLVSFLALVNFLFIKSKIKQYMIYRLDIIRNNYNSLFMSYVF